MPLPDAQKAFIDERKFLEYCLNEEHPRGRHKARVFSAALGITRHNYRLIIELILQKVKTSKALFTYESAFGKHYRVEFAVQIEGQKAQLCTTWIVRFDENFPRLVSCYVLT